MAKGYALVTGASSGIGAEIARLLGAMGHPLILTARRGNRMADLAHEIREGHKLDVLVVEADLSLPGAGRKLYDEIIAGGQQVDILVNNAGVGMTGRFLENNMEEMEAMFRLNMFSLTELCCLFGADMKSRGHGRIMNVASASAFLSSPYVSAYAATKAYVMSFSEAIYHELKGSGVTVTCLYPGVTTTEFYEAGHVKHPPLMNISILSAAEVAKIGVHAMFAGKRAIVPGFINKVNAFFSRVLPRGLVSSIAGRLLKDANNL